MSTRGTPASRSSDDLPLELDAAWGIPAMFGGALAAAVLRADRAGYEGGWLPTEVQVLFHRPVPPGSARVALEVLREGRTTRATETRVQSEGRHAATVLASWSPAESLPLVPAPAPRRLPAPATPAPGDLSARVDWRAERAWPSRRTGGLGAWIRSRDAEWELPASESAPRTMFDPAWYLVAGDLLTPAILRPGEALRIATVSLQLTVLRRAEPGWIRQLVHADRAGDRATARLELRTARGDLLATVAQSARLAPASPEELPVSATGFGWGRAHR